MSQDQNRALIEREWGDKIYRDGFQQKGARVYPETLYRLLDAARAEGAPADEGARVPPDLTVTSIIHRVWDAAYDRGRFGVASQMGEYADVVSKAANEILALSPPAAEGKEDTCGILPPRHDTLCVSASPCLLPDRHDGPHACETRDGRRSWQSDDDCDCCDVTDPDRCITWSPAPAAEPVADPVFVAAWELVASLANEGTPKTPRAKAAFDAAREACLTRLHTPQQPVEISRAIDLGAPCSLEACPPGLFLADAYGTLGMKSEYHTDKGAVEAYIVESGEFFWGDNPQTVERQRAQIVRPIPHDAIISKLSGKPS